MEGNDLLSTTAAPLLLGLDIGSVSVDTAVIDAGGGVLWTDYSRIHGGPLQTALEVLERLFALVPADTFQAAAVTGSGAQVLAPLINAISINEIISAARGVAALHPQTRTIIDMGGEDAKLILVSPGKSSGLRIDDFAMNTMCAAGTGSFLDQQSHRLGYSIEQFSQLATKSQNPPRLAGRCSVFAKTDMIHLQQEATPDYDIVAGLCFAMARNLKSNIAKGKQVIPPVCFIGGVAANSGVHRALKEVLDLSEEDFIVPEHFACMGALGAALHARDLGLKRSLPGLDGLGKGAGSHTSGALRLEQLKWNDHHQTGLKQYTASHGHLTGYLGIDVGSISTNVVVIDKDRRVLSRQYLMTAGRPLDATKQGLQRVAQEIGDRVTILGAGTTGSGRYLTADFLGADLVRNEITAQATAAASIDHRVDTIFEIGGQDSKYIALKDGAIVDFMMNKVCAAGTGSFLEEQAEKLGISIKEEFGDLALSARKPFRMGERCTVFMESDLVSLQANGASTPELVAGLSYSIVQNYLNKVVEGRHVGERVFFQGATAANRGIVAAFEAVLKRPITVPPHHDVTGAIGAAILAMTERTWQKSSFKGFHLSQAQYRISTFECSGCPNTCAIRKVKLDGNRRPLFYGSRCDKYDLERDQGKGGGLPDLFAEREQLLTCYMDVPARERGVIGIPRAMFFREWLPFFSAFCTELGYRLIESGPTTKKLIHRGLEHVVNEPCFPIKVAHGHIAELMARGVERILLPALVNVPSPHHPDGAGQVCPYSQTLAYTVPASFDLTGVELVSAPLRLGMSPGVMRGDLARLANILGAPRRLFNRAISRAWAAQRDFQYRLKTRGQEVLAERGPRDLSMVVVSRPYNGGDPGINLGLPSKMGSMGVLALPMDYLNLSAYLGRPELAEMYWRYGQSILASGLLVRKTPGLYAVMISNFGCGPDSFIAHFFNQIMEGKPYLEIEIDEHSADVGALTRIEAFLDSLKSTPPLPPVQRPVRRRNIKTFGRIIYVPPMVDSAQTIAAAFRANGKEAYALPHSNARTQELGRQHTSGKECYPCALTTGDMLKLLLDGREDPDKAAFLMPGGGGPCRFGQYHRYHRKVLDELGFESVPIYSPDQSEKMYSELNFEGGGDFSRLAWRGVVAVDLLQKALLETRPYEASHGDSDRAYGEHLTKTCACIENRGDLAQVMAEAAEAFTSIPRNGGLNSSKPLVGVVGEIYTRLNGFANEEIVRQIEELGGEAWLPGLGEWVLYVNWCSARQARLRHNWKLLCGTWLENYFQQKDERWLAGPWRGLLKTLHDPKTREVLDLATPYLHHTYEGEAVLSIGKSRDMERRGVGGVVNVIPFTCMPGNIASALMKRFREDHGGLPFLSLSMDGQEQTSSRIRLEAFMHQVRQHG